MHFIDVLIIRLFVTRLHRAKSATNIFFGSERACWWCTILSAVIHGKLDLSLNGARGSWQFCDVVRFQFESDLVDSVCRENGYRTDAYCV